MTGAASAQTLLAGAYRLHTGCCPVQTPLHCPAALCTCLLAALCDPWQAGCWCTAAAGPHCSAALAHWWSLTSNTLPQEPVPDTPPMRAAGRAQWEQQAVRLARLCCWVLQAVPHRHQATSGSMQTPCLACITRHSAARLLQQLLQPSSRPASWPGERTWFG